MILVFDTCLFGDLIRRERRAAGYKRADDFAKAVTEATGCKLSRDVLYKIEQGRQEPTPSQMLGLASFLNHGYTFSTVTSYFTRCTWAVRE